MGARLRSWSRGGLRAAAGLLVLALCAEAILRLFGYGSFIIYRPDPDLVWVPVPSQRGKTVAGFQPITINGDGLRYRSEFDPRKSEPDEIRIFAFGDSVTMGWGVDDDSHYSAVLEQLLTADYPDRLVRVVSAGVNAYPQTLCVRRFEKLLEQGQEMDLAILAYSFNASFENLARLEGEEKARFRTRVALKGLVRRSAVYNYLIEDLLRSAVYYRVRTRLVEGTWGLEEDQARESRVVDSIEMALASMKEVAEEHDVEVVFLLLGTAGQRELNPYQNVFGEFSQREGVPLVNMVERLEGEDDAALFMDHVHPDATGHDLIARELRPVVRSALETPDRS